MKTWILVTFFVFHFISLHHFEFVALVTKLQFGSWFLEEFWLWGLCVNRCARFGFLLSFHMLMRVFAFGVCVCSVSHNLD